MKLIHKKGDGLSLNVIVIAVIAILVLVVLAVIFFNQMGLFSDGVSACNGECRLSANDCPDNLPVPVPQNCQMDDGVTKGNYCCISPGAQQDNI